MNSFGSVLQIFFKMAYVKNLTRKKEGRKEDIRVLTQGSYEKIKLLYFSNFLFKYILKLQVQSILVT